MAKHLVLLVVGLAAGVALAFGGFANANDMSEDRVREIVKEYIANHGGELTAAIENHKIQQQQQAASQAISDHTPVYGPDEAKVTIIEFSDLQCPFCRRVQDTMAQLRERYGDEVRFAFKHLPLEQIHPEARMAARAAQAAHQQGKFWEFMDVIWDKQEFLGEKLYMTTAKDLGLDTKEFREFMESEEANQQIAQDLRDAQKVGARGTPFFLINGQPASGAMPLETFTNIIDDILSRQ